MRFKATELAEGWEKFRGAIDPLLEQVRSEKLQLSAVVSGPAIITDEYVYRGRYAWNVELPLVVTLTSASNTTRKAYRVSATVMRMPVVDSVKAIAITNFKVE